MKVFGYTRLNEQRVHPRNMDLEQQSQMIQEYAAQHGWQVTEILADIGKTSASLKLPNLLRIFQMAEAGEMDILVIARLDRVTRTVRLYNQFLKKVCVDNKVTLVSVKEGIDSSKPDGLMALNIIDIIAKWDLKMISDRTKELIEKKREIGESVGHAPYGFVYKDKKLVPFPNELKTVYLIREKRSEESMSYHKIAKYLNEHRIPSKRGGRWYAETVKTIYENELYDNEALVELTI